MPQKPVKIAIIGGGLSGIALAIELKAKLNLDSFTIYERSTGVGGTWRDNTYPGCACDVPSHWYSLSTELNPEWTYKYSSQPEIQKYWEGVHKKHNLARKTKLDSEFVKAVWVEENQGYVVDFKRANGSNFQITCDVLVSCIGGFSTPLDKPVGMKGIEDFEGEVFHSARWRHDLDLKGKRVGVIGNGCSAAQFIPIISEEKTTEVLNFVRTPNWLMPRDQKAYSSLTKSLFRCVPGFMRTYRNFIAMTSDVRFIVWVLEMWGLRHFVEEVSMKYIMDTAPKKYHGFLIPKFPFGCKRVIMDPGYLAALHRTNVDMITDPIATITKEGIRGKSGKEYEFDVLILGTGFDLSEGGLGINVTGRNGQSVTQQWTEQGGPQAYLGTTLANFPNFMLILGPNVASGSASVVYSTEAQVNYIVKMIAPMVKHGVTSFECKLDAEMRYNREIQARLKNTVWNGGCKSYYKLGDKVIATFPGTTTEFWWKTRNPVWESYLQMGGTRRMAVRHRGGQLLKSLAMIALVVLFQRLGYKKIKNQSMLFLVMRYQDIMNAVASLRA